MTEYPLLRHEKPYPKQWFKVPVGFVTRFLIQDYASWGICCPKKDYKDPMLKKKVKGQ